MMYSLEEAKELNLIETAILKDGTVIEVITKEAIANGFGWWFDSDGNEVVTNNWWTV